MKVLSQGRRATLAVATVQAGLFFVSWFITSILAAGHATSAYIVMLFSIGLIFVGLNVLAQVDFPDKACRTMGKISVITIFAINTIYNIVSVFLRGSWYLTIYVHLLIWISVYGGLVALYFVFNAKFPLNSGLPQAAGFKKSWNEGKVATSFLALVSSGVIFVNYFSNLINALEYGTVNTYAFLFCCLGLIFVGLNVLALADFSERACRITGKVTVIAIFAVCFLAVIIDVIRYTEYYEFNDYVYMFLHIICYAGLPLIYFFVMNAKFPLNKADAPAVEGGQINN